MAASAHVDFAHVSCRYLNIHLKTIISKISSETSGNDFLKSSQNYFECIYSAIAIADV